jgi:hypothetical protein
MSDERARLRRRLSFIVQHIDAGLYRQPEKAADEIIDTVLSILPAHRSDLLALIESVPPMSDRKGEEG